MLCEITENITNSNIFLPSGTGVELDWTQAEVIEEDNVENDVVVFFDISEKIGGKLTKGGRKAPA